MLPLLLLIALGGLQMPLSGNAQEFFDYIADALTRDSTRVIISNPTRSIWEVDGIGMLYTHSIRPDWLVYSFDFSKTEIDKFTKVITVLDAEAPQARYKSIPSDPFYCGNLLQPGTVLMSQFSNPRVEFRSADPNNPNWRFLRDQPCCKIREGGPCPGCYRDRIDVIPQPQYTTSYDGKYAVMTIKAIIDGREIQTILSILCLYCCQYACSNSYCSNGQYVSKTSDLDPVTNLELRNLVCTSCAPGTWNTCKYKESCTWYVPQTDFSNLSQDVYTIGRGPIGACYPCAWASTAFFHYSNSPTKASTIIPTIPWKCPGGTNPPVNCIGGDKVSSLDYSRCVCKDGLYGSDDSVCTQCPTGHYCKDGIREQCPDHQYQPNQGQSKCIPCVDSQDENGIYTGCGEGKQLEQCLRINPSSQHSNLFQNCKPCHQCSRSFITPSNGEVKCYKG